MKPKPTNHWHTHRYSLYAPVYDIIRFFPPLTQARKHSIAQLDAQPGERVLLVGAGTGIDLLYMPNGLHIHAIDISPAMVRRIAQRAQQHHIPVITDVMDAQSLRFDDASFDHCILHLTLAVVPDALACAREVARVVRPGGRIAIFDKFAPDGRAISQTRRILNVVATIFFTDITRQLRTILQQTHLTLLHEEPAFLLPSFTIALAEVPT